MFRRFLTFARSTAKKIEATKKSWVWRHRKSKDSNPESFVANILIVKNPIYAKVGRVCVESFLYYHPNAIVKLHVDDMTRQAVKTEILDRNISQNISMVAVPTQSSTWQEQKIDLILSLSGTSEFFMDADLRWNSRIRTISEVTFYVNEFFLREKSPFRQIVESFRGGKYKSAMMRNTSFFTFGGHQLETQALFDVKQIECELLRLIKSDLLGSIDRDQVSRLSEQLALSIASEDWNTTINTLKVSDGHKDGAFVESSYFGATGSTF